MKVNNVSLDAVKNFADEVQRDGSSAIKTKRVEGEWVFVEGKPQFTALVNHGASASSLEADAPDFLGGGGMKPDPVQYCLFGLAACFAQTFASIAAEKGVRLTRLKVAAENKVNLTKPLGLGDAPIVESVKLTAVASTEGENSRLTEIEREARERCPGIYCLTHPIRLETELV
ncbi:OsmC family protein [Candidatus Micrarchaeota archaeon]|nr:OsmC family protein [Candidatus Micrarchaeota archaeon]MBI5177115.1 OsmC family protein [Candidatus Micrarchaeota archaeon]